MASSNFPAFHCDFCHWTSHAQSCVQPCTWTGHLRTQQAEDVTSLTPSKMGVRIWFYWEKLDKVILKTMKMVYLYIGNICWNPIELKTHDQTYVALVVSTQLDHLPKGSGWKYKIFETNTYARHPNNLLIRCDMQTLRVQKYTSLAGVWMSRAGNPLSVWEGRWWFCGGKSFQMFWISSII